MADTQCLSVAQVSVSRLEGVCMSVAAFKAALSSRDPQVRKAVREVLDGTYTAVELRELLQAVAEVRSDDSLHYAWPDCELTRQAFTPTWLSAAEFSARLIDPDLDVRRSVWLTMHDDKFMYGVPADYFPAVVTVLGSEDHAYAWPDCRVILEGSCLWGHPDTLELVMWVLARSIDGLGERLASIIGLPKGLYPLRWPVPITESGTVECYFCSPDHQTRQESAADCLQVRTLVTLLSCSIEALRVKARDELVRLGPGVAGILRQIRRTNLPGRRAALLTLADLGWDEVDPADRAIIHRLMRIQRINEVAEPVPDPSGTWYAIPTTDQVALLEAFDLCEPVEVSLRAGFAMWDPAHRGRMRWQRRSLKWARSAMPRVHAFEYPEVFVTPALDGWTLVLTDDEVLDEAGDVPDDAYDRDKHAHRRCAELSRRFGTAHWYNNPADYEIYPYAGWCIAENGAIVYHARYDRVLSHGDEVQIGPGECTFKELRAWLDAHSCNKRLPPAPHSVVPPNMWKRLDHIATTGTDPGEDYKMNKYTDTRERNRPLPKRIKFGVPRIAQRLSVGLETLGPHTRIEGTGVLAVRADPHPPQRYGAPACMEPNMTGFR